MIYDIEGNTDKSAKVVKYYIYHQVFLLQVLNSGKQKNVQKYSVGSKEQRVICSIIPLML
jgi:hypothetical protein